MSMNHLPSTGERRWSKNLNGRGMSLGCTLVLASLLFVAACAFLADVLGCNYVDYITRGIVR